MPSAKSKHTAKWDRCIKKVKEKSPHINPYAICSSSIEDAGLKKKHQKRSKEGYYANRKRGLTKENIITLFSNFINENYETKTPSYKQLIKLAGYLSNKISDVIIDNRMRNIRQIHNTTDEQITQAMFRLRKLAELYEIDITEFVNESIEDYSNLMIHKNMENEEQEYYEKAKELYDEFIEEHGDTSYDVANDIPYIEEWLETRDEPEIFAEFIFNELLKEK